MAIILIVITLVGALTFTRQSITRQISINSPQVLPNTVQLNQDDQNKEIELHVGQQFLVSMPTNPTTGTNTYLVTSGEEPWLLVNKMYKRDSENQDQVGTGGTAVYTFKTTHSGMSPLILFESRMEDPAKSLKQVSPIYYIIKVK